MFAKLSLTARYMEYDKRKAATWRAKASTNDLSGAPSAAPDDAVEVESPSGGECIAPWTGGFVTADGSHVPLFIPPAPKSVNERPSLARQDRRNQRANHSG